jgi:hypothetical protein
MIDHRCSLCQALGGEQWRLSSDALGNNSHEATTDPGDCAENKVMQKAHDSYLYHIIGDALEVRS